MAHLAFFLMSVTCDKLANEHMQMIQHCQSNTEIFSLQKPRAGPPEQATVGSWSPFLFMLQSRHARVFPVKSNLQSGKIKVIYNVIFLKQGLHRCNSHPPDKIKLTITAIPAPVSHKLSKWEQSERESGQHRQN